MSGYKAEIEAIHNASEAAASAAQQARAVELTDGAIALATALPGGRAASAATTLADYWQNQLTTWTSAMGSYSEKLGSAAESYSKHEDAAEADFRQITPSGRARPV
ncbi:hypothetical protein [Amycolatopsis palatopharyngis]|uniref:hypothetical protein n=1 Tax=Amycolatopsis palatopharyngis TaxID=187982 RepID=UPI000E260925|nr:hypothetical protein [Amycolatopsis palatopharyngis]